jgi:hypothetical protein
MNAKTDEISARETCTILAALRLFQQVRPCDLCPDGTPIVEMEEFAKFAPLDLDEIDDLYARIKAFRNDAARPTVSAPEPLP